MEVNRTALWILLGVCSAAGVVIQLAVTVRGFSAQHGSWRAAPWRFAGAVLEAVMMGVGWGLLAATVIFFAAALLVRLGL